MNKEHKLLCVAVAFLLFIPMSLGAQDVHDKLFSVGTNLVDWADLGTVILDVGIPVARHFSLSIGGRFNPWQFTRSDPDYIIQNRQKTAYLGVKYWLWYVNSGLWIEGRTLYTKFDVSGIWRPSVDSGQGAGAGFSIGYSYMLSENINIDFGAGLWGGYLFDYILFHCPYCYDIREEGARFIIAPDNIRLGVSFIF